MLVIIFPKGICTPNLLFFPHKVLEKHGSFGEKKKKSLFGSSCTLEKCQREKGESLTFISARISCALHPQPHEAPDPALSLKILSCCLIEEDDLRQMQARGAMCCLLCPITPCQTVCPI